MGKTHCKTADVNIDDPAFNVPAVIKCFEGKLRRSDFRGVLIRLGGITNKEIAEERVAGKCEKIVKAEKQVAKVLTEERIQKRNLRLAPIRQFKREDGLTHKMRDICQESPEQQLMEYMAVHALQPLFKAKRNLLNIAARCVSRHDRCGRKDWLEHEQRILCTAATGG